MRVKYIQILLVITLLLFHSCAGCRNLPKSEPANFSITCEAEASTVHLEDHKRIKLSVYIDPKNEVARKSPYYQVIDWSVLGGVKGELLGPEGEKVTSDTKLKNGENVFFYEPSEIGDHTITLQVTDKYNDLKKEVIFPSITVEKKPTPYFKVILKAASKEIFSHQSAPVELEITSEDPKAKELPYTIKKIEVSQGVLWLANGKEVKADSKLIFGKQNLIFKPGIQVGNIKIKLVVSNTKGESTANLSLEVKLLNFTIELKTSSNHIFSYQTAPIDLTVLSPVEGAKDLAYTVKDIGVTKGELQFEESGRKVESGSQIKYGTQHLIFKPNGEVGQARIELIVINTETCSENNTGLALEVKPLNFKSNIWVKEPTEEDRKLIKEDFAVLEVMLSGVDKKLVSESWKIIEWKFSDGVQRVITDKNLKELAEFTIKAEGSNQFYLKLPNIRLDRNPTLTVKVEGPGKSIQETVVQLSTIQKSIVNKHQKELLGDIEKQARDIDNHLKLPAKGENYEPIKATSQLAKRQLVMLKNMLVGVQASMAVTGDREIERITKEIEELEKKKDKLDVLKKACKKKKSSFSAEFKTISRKFFNHQDAVLNLELASEEQEAKGLSYTVKEIKVTKGALCFKNGEPVKVGSTLIFGTQSLIFKPNAQQGEVEINLTVESAAGTQSIANIVLEVKSIGFKAELQPTSSSILNHKNIYLPLVISSSEAEARSLVYSVKEIEVTKGALHLENGERVKVGSTLLFGNQNLTFKPNGEIGRAKVKLIIGNNTNSESMTGMVMEVKPVAFKTELKSDTKSIFSHQHAVITLDITSSDEGAAHLDYTIKDLEILNGELYFGSDDRPLETGSKIRFGWQTLVFRPRAHKKGEEIKAVIQLTITNGKGSEDKSSLALLIKPIEFKIDAWINKPTAEGRKLMQEDFGLLKIQLSNIDKELMEEESWKLVDWSCSDGIQRGITVGNSAKQLTEFPLDNKKKNTFYLHLPQIKLDSEPTLTLQVKGPGNTIQETVVLLNPIQKAIISEKLDSCVASISHLERKIDDCLKLPVFGKNYYTAKGISQEATKQIVAAKEVISGEVKVVFAKHSEQISESLRTIEQKKAELDFFREACEQKKASFIVELNATSKAIFTHQTSQIVLKISSHEEEAINLAYTVKEIEVTKGTVHFENGKQVKVGNILPFGTQHLIFKPLGELGEAQVNLTIENNKGKEINTGLVLHVKPIEFKVDAWIKESTEKEKDLMLGDFGVVEVKLSGVDKELINEPWRIIDWEFRDMKNSTQSEQKVDLSFMEDSKENQIQKSIDSLLEKIHVKENELVNVKLKLKKSKEELEKTKEGALEKAIEGQVGEANEKLKRAEEKVEELNKGLKSAEKQVGQSKMRIEKAEASVKYFIEFAEKTDENVKRSAETLEKAEKRINKFNRKTKEYQESLEHAQNRLGTAEENYEKATKQKKLYFQNNLSEKECVDNEKEAYDELKRVQGNIHAAKYLMKQIRKKRLPPVERQLELAKIDLKDYQEQLECDKERLKKAEKQLEEYKVAFKEAGLLEEAAKKQIQEAKKEFSMLEENVKNKKQGELKAAEIVIQKQEQALRIAEEKVKRVVNRLKRSEELFEIQKRKIQEKIQRLRDELELEKKLQENKVGNQAFKPVLLNRALDELSTFSLDSKEKNQFYLKLPTIQLDTELILTLQVEGPGNTIKEFHIHLSEFLRVIVTRKMQKSLEVLRKLSRETDNYKSLPVTGNNYSKVKAFTKEIDLQLEGIFNDIEASCDPKWLESPVLLSLPVAQDIIREKHNFEKSKARLNDLKKACKEKGITFQADLHVASRSIFIHQVRELELEITSSEKKAEELEYTIKDIDVKNGNLIYFINRKKVKIGDKVSFGKQKLTFESTGQIGVAKVSLTIENGKGGESSITQVLKVKPITFKAGVHIASKKLFTNQSIPMTLEVTSGESKAKGLEYTIKEIEVKNGGLYFDNGNKVKLGDKLSFGTQNLIFKSTDRTGDALIHLRIDNGKGTDSNVGIVLDVHPINFRVDAWLKEPEEDEKKLIKGNSAILEIMLSDVDDELVKGPWKLIGWKFDTVSTLRKNLELKNFGTALQSFHLSLLEGISEQKIRNKIQALGWKKEAESRLISGSKEYAKGMIKNLMTKRANINDIEGKLRSITYSYQPSMALVTLHESRSHEKSYQEGKHMLELSVQQLIRDIELQDKRIKRDEGLKAIQDKKIDNKLVRLHSSLEVIKHLKETQDVDKPFSSNPILLDFDSKQLTAYSLEVGVVNKFCLILPNVSKVPTLTLQVEGPEKILKEFVIELISLLQPIAARKVAEALKSIRNISGSLDESLKLPIVGSSYEKLRETSQRVKIQLKEVFKDIESYYGKAWWKHPIIMSVRDLEYVVEEMIILENKKEKLNEHKEACKQKKLTFKVNATLRQPEGDKIMLMPYAVLKIKLLDVDESLANEDWKLLDWKCDDEFPRGIVNRDLHELAEFSLNSKGETDLYLKLPNFKIATTPTLALRIGIPERTVQEVILEVGPIQNAIMGKEISQFLEVIQKLNKEVEDYLNLPIRERNYDKLTDFTGKVSTKLKVYNNAYKSANRTYKTDPKRFSKILPGVLGRDLEWLIEKGIPALEENYKKLEKELDEWDDAIKSFASLQGKPKEQCISSIYTPDKEGNFLIHMWAEEGSDDEKVGRFIIERTLDINAEGKDKLTPLHMVILSENSKKLKKALLLLKYGVKIDPNIKLDNYPILLSIINDGIYSRNNQEEAGEYHEIFCALLDRGADPNARLDDNWGETPLMMVIRRDETSYRGDKIRKLLDMGAAPGQCMSKGGYAKYFRDDKYWTPLFAAIERGDVDTIRLLLRKTWIDKKWTANVWQSKSIIEVDVWQVICNSRIDNDKKREIITVLNKYN